jgi:type II secretory pathway pseudopilin PulG
MCFTGVTMSEASNQKSRIKYYIVAALVIIIVAAILIVPRFRRYQQNRRAEAIRTAIEALQRNVDDYWKKHGSIGGYDIDLALVELGLPSRTTNNWSFAIAWKPTEIYTTEMVDKLKDVSENRTVHVAPYQIIMAVASADNPVGEGRKTWFDGDSNSYHGFGYDERIEPNWATIFPKP